MDDDGSGVFTPGARVVAKDSEDRVPFDNSEVCDLTMSGKGVRCDQFIQLSTVGSADDECGGAVFVVGGGRTRCKNGSGFDMFRNPFQMGF